MDHPSPPFGPPFSFPTDKLSFLPSGSAGSSPTPAPSAPADDDATITELTRAFVRNWEESQAPADDLRRPEPPGQVSTIPPPEAVPAGAPARRIMVVDDEPMITRTLQMLLDQLGYVTTTFNLPDEALARFAAAPDDFDLIITDYWMPGLDGLDLAAKIRARSATVGIFLLSGYSVRLSPRQARDLGIGAVLTKPIEISTLAEVLAGHFAKLK